MPAMCILKNTSRKKKEKNKIPLKKRPTIRWVFSLRIYPLKLSDKQHVVKLCKRQVLIRNDLFNLFTKLGNLKGLWYKLQGMLNNLRVQIDSGWPLVDNCRKTIGITHNLKPFHPVLNFS